MTYFVGNRPFKLPDMYPTGNGINNTGFVRKLIWKWDLLKEPRGTLATVTKTDQELLLANFRHDMPKLSLYNRNVNRKFQNNRQKSSFLFCFYFNHFRRVLVGAYYQKSIFMFNLFHCYRILKDNTKRMKKNGRKAIWPMQSTSAYIFLVRRPCAYVFL